MNYLNLNFKNGPLTTTAGFASASGRFILLLYYGAVLAGADVAARVFQRAAAVPAELLRRQLLGRRSTRRFAYRRQPLFQRCNLNQ